MSETTLAKAAPKVTTVVSDAVVQPDDEIFDTLTVTGLGKTPATVEVELYGPYASRADIDCEGAPYWKGKVEADRRRRRTPRRRRRSGAPASTCSASGSPARRPSPPTRPSARSRPRPSLAAPLILGGRGDDVATSSRAGRRRRRSACGSRGSGIDAPVSARSGSTLKSGALGIPENIRRVGWWRDGAAPGDETGTVLIAGHVDSAKNGAGAFYALKSARRGDTVTSLGTQDAALPRDVDAARCARQALPTSIYTRTGLAAGSCS